MRNVFFGFAISAALFAASGAATAQQSRIKFDPSLKSEPCTTPGWCGKCDCPSKKWFSAAEPGSLEALLNGLPDDAGDNSSNPARRSAPKP